MNAADGSQVHTLEGRCQGRNERGPLGRRKREPVVGTIKVGFARGKGLWSVAEEAFSPRGRSAAEGSALGRRVAFAAALLEAVAIAVHLQDVDVVSKPIQQGAGEPLGAEDLGPFFKG